MCLETHTHIIPQHHFNCIFALYGSRTSISCCSLPQKQHQWKITRKQVLWSSWCKSPFWEASLSHKVMVKRLLIAIQEREYLPQLRKREQKVASASCMNLVTAPIQLGRHHITALPLIMLLFTQPRKDCLTQEPHTSSFHVKEGVLPQK